MVWLTVDTSDDFGRLSALPTGGFAAAGGSHAHSGGMEAAVAAGRVADLQELEHS